MPFFFSTRTRVTWSVPARTKSDWTFLKNARSSGSERQIGVVRMFESVSENDVGQFFVCSSLSTDSDSGSSGSSLDGAEQPKANALPTASARKQTRRRGGRMVESM